MPHFVIWKKNAFGTLEQNFQEEIISWKGNKGKEVSRETDNALEVNKLKEREKKKSGENRKLKIIRIACIGHDLSVISSPNKRDSSSRYDHSITQIVSRGIFSKVPRGTKTSGETSRKRRKGRRKKEERTYANWQLEIATERNWNRLRGKLLKLHLTGNIKTHEYYYSFPPVSKIGHKELQTFRKHVYHEFHACQDAFYYVCRVYLFKRLDQYYQYITSINKNQILNINLSIIIA